nr:MAG TPA: hypothetical protein [Caudoviricetes sp.]
MSSYLTDLSACVIIIVQINVKEAYPTWKQLLKLKTL